LKKYIFINCLFFLFPLFTGAQKIEFGVETTFGSSYSTFKGNLSDIVGFTEFAITRGQVDSALASLNLVPPRWIRDLFPGIRIEIDQEIAKQLHRNNNSIRFFTRFYFVGASFAISEPRLSEPLPSKKWNNQLRSLQLSMNGEVEELSRHIANLALEDSKIVTPFFRKRYDLDLYLHTKKLLLGNEPIATFGRKGTLDVELTTGLRFTADPSPVVDLGSILFISERLDNLIEGRLLAPFEDITDQIGEAIQANVFGKFKDPRIVSSMGWMLRGVVPIDFGLGFTFVAGTEINVNKLLLIKNVSPSFSTYYFVGFRTSLSFGK
jgi:hypothetical protein